MKQNINIILLLMLLFMPLIGVHLYSQQNTTSLFLTALGDFLALVFCYLSVALFPQSILRIFLGIMLAEAFAIFQFLRLISFYFQGESFNDRFFFHLNWNSLTEAGAAYLPLIFSSFFYFVIVAVLSLFYWRSFFVRWTFNLKRGSQLSVLFLSALVIEPDMLQLARYSVLSKTPPVNLLLGDNFPWKELGLNRLALAADLKNVTPGKNLVMIYLESLENLYLDEKVFPGLTPNLNRLKEKGLFFSNMRQIPGTGWTVAGIVSSQCGTPLLSDSVMDGNDMLQSGFLNKATCLGDLLAAAGYHQVFLGGASTHFAGKGDFLKSHGYDDVNGRDELVHFLEDPTYVSGWGLYDDSLFAIAAQRYAELAAANQPFNLTLLTIDTHHPTGHPSRTCPKYKKLENTMLDAVHCSDFLVNKFIETLKNHPAWKNTVVVLLSDHLAMRNTAKQFFPENYDRTLFFTILNAKKRVTVNQPGTHMDIPPTILETLGVSHKQEFLAGRSLLNSAPTTVNSVTVNENRLQAFKFINTHLLTNRSSDLCETHELLGIKNGKLLLAGQEVSMNVSGNAVSPDKLGNDYGFIAFLNLDGSINSTMTVNAMNMGQVLYQFRAQPFLAILPNDKLPSILHLTVNNGPGLAVVIGSLQGGIRLLAQTEDISALKVTLPNCSNQIKKVLHTTQTRQLALPEVCPHPTKAMASYDVKSGKIKLDRVSVENSWYSAELEQNDNKNYQVVELEPLGAITNSDFPDIGNCTPYFGKQELIIPAMTAGNDLMAMHMHQTATETEIFEILESISYSKDTR